MLVGPFAGAPLGAHHAASLGRWRTIDPCSRLPKRSSGRGGALGPCPLDTRGRLRAETTHGWRLIDPRALDEGRNEMYPMLALPPEWRKLEDGTPAPNWVAAVALSQLGR